jgi:polysaccharide deacetylase 2 family uncharacterized protein YibQ
MFAKQRTPPEFTPPPELKRSVLRSPYVGAGGVGGLMVSTVLAVIAIGGDPAAGAPRVRIPLGGPGAAAEPPGWRAALSPETPDLSMVTVDTLQLHEDVAMAGVEPLAEGGGHATLTLPGGGRIMGQPEEPDDLPLLAVKGTPLGAAPFAGLTTAGPNGLLPVIGPDGKTPAQAYAKPFKDNGKPKISLVIGGLGLNPATTRAAIEGLPAEVTLSFVPYAEGLQGWIDMARANGHEVLLEIPMEPMDYPDNDPGPYTLLAQAQSEELNKRMDWLLSRAQGYFGVTNYLGGRFLASDSGVQTFAGVVKRRGLAFLDDGQAARVQVVGLQRASADRVVDDQLSDEAIDRQLLALEAAALDRGKALGAGFAYPVTVKTVAKWAQGLERRGYQLAPASAMTRG